MIMLREWHAVNMPSVVHAMLG